MYSDDIKNLALRLYTRFLSLRKVADLIDTSHSTISRWKNFKKTDRKCIVKKLDNCDILECINIFVISHPFCTIQDIKLKVRTVFKIEVSLETMRMFLINNNYTRKRARYYSEPKDDNEKLESFLKLRKQYVDEDRKFVSIDESSFGKNYLPNVGYSKKGQRLYVKRPKTMLKTHSVLTAVSMNDPVIYSKKIGSYNTESFYDFLSGLNYPKRTVIIMDNVSFHHSSKVKEWDVLYIVPYSPIFNPIEGVFSIVKRSFQKCRSIEDSFKSVTNNHIVKFFKQSFDAIKRF